MLRTDSLLSFVDIQSFYGQFHKTFIGQIMKKCPKAYFTEARLASFYLGAPVRIAITQRMKHELLCFLDGYYCFLAQVTKVYDEEFLQKICGVLYDSKEDVKIWYIPHISHLEQVLTHSLFFDVLNSLIFPHVYHRLYENIFKHLFPKIYNNARRGQEKLLARFGGNESIKKFSARISRELSIKNGETVSVYSRILMPAGLYKESLRKRVSMNKVQDFLCLNVLHESNRINFEKMVDSVHMLLRRDSVTYTHENKVRGKYKGSHFYFFYHYVPVEIKIRSGDRSYTEKKRSIDFQKKSSRYSIVDGYGREREESQEPCL